MAKSVAITLAGGGEPRDVTINPGATVADVLREANLQGYRLSKPGGQPFGESEVLYPLVVDGDKLVASTPSDVGASAPTSLPSSSFFAALLRGLRRLFGGRRPVRRPAETSAQAPSAPVRQAEVSGGAAPGGRGPVASSPSGAMHQAPASVHASAARVAPRAPASQSGEPRQVRREARAAAPPARRRVARRMGIVVGPDRRPYWEQQRWQRNGHEYRGYYRTRYGAWDGAVVERAPGIVAFYIWNPPHEVLLGPHRLCFRELGQGWYGVHFRVWTSDVNSAILAVERTIEEAYACAAMATSA